MFLNRHLFCRDCGSTVTWETQRKYWRCRSCGMHTTEMELSNLPDAIQSAFNQLIGEPERVVAPVHHPEIQLDKLRREQEIQRKLDSGDYEADEVIALILEQASLRYDRCSVGEYDPLTLQIKEFLRSAEPSSDFDGELYKKIVSKTIVSADGSIQLQLKNGQMI